MKSKQGSLLLECCLSLMIVTLMVILAGASFQTLNNSKRVIEESNEQINYEAEQIFSTTERCDEECLLTPSPDSSSSES